MKIGYIILAHQKPKQLSKLISVIQSESTFFFLHIDKRADKQSFLNSSFKDKAKRPLIEFTNNSSVFITVSAVISKNDLLKFNSVDVKLAKFC